MLLRRALIATAGSAAMALTALPAHAALYSHNDAVQDVWTETCADVEVDECTTRIDPAMRNGDIANANIRHQWRRVLVRVKHRNLAGADVNAHLVRIVTNEGIERHVSLFGLGGEHPEVAMTTRDGETEVPCSGLWGGYDFGTEMATVIIPRSCLSAPRWVRVGVGAVTIQGISEEEVLFGLDDLMKNDGVNQDTVALSPRIRRS